MSEHQWYYYKEGLLSGEEKVGPVPEPKFKELLTVEIKRKTKVMSPTRTKGSWAYASGIPGIAKAIEKREAKQKAQKQELIVEPNAMPETLAAANVTTVNAEVVNESTQSKKLRDAVAGYLTSGESISIVVVQSGPMVVKADGFVFTSKRLILARRKLLGRFDFHDVLWMDLGDAHAKEDIVGATFQIFDRKREQRIWLSMLPKEGARELYRIAQEREEAAFHTRRRMRMEEAAAGASKVNVSTPVNIAAEGQKEDDLVARLQKLKSMLEAGLIEQNEFDLKKSQILDQI